jgi:hypothetical protein
MTPVGCLLSLTVSGLAWRSCSLSGMADPAPPTLCRTTYERQGTSCLSIDRATAHASHRKKHSTANWCFSRLESEVKSNASVFHQQSGIPHELLQQAQTSHIMDRKEPALRCYRKPNDRVSTLQRKQPITCNQYLAGYRCETQPHRPAIAPLPCVGG